MATAKIQYQGELRTEATHVRSGQIIITDAPTDNHGKGEAFSPTDLVATALVSCMITVMGIKARDRSWDMGTLSGEVKKIMADAPRRIAALDAVIRFEGHGLSEGEKKVLENVAMTCPVAQSLKADLHVQVRFEYN
ncbi:MAG: OsmC family protein [Bacteroidia bacterium]